MFNLGLGELIIIAAIALIFIGPKQLPEVARTVARMINEWRRTTSDLSRSIMETKTDMESAVQKAIDVEHRPIETKKDPRQTEATNSEQVEETKDPNSTWDT